MVNAHLNAKLLVDVLGQMLGAVHAAMLSACTSKTEHQTGKTTLYVASHMGVGQFIDAVQESQYLAIVFQKSDNGLVQSRQFLVWLVAARIVRRATVEHIATAIARLVFRNTFSKREAEHPDHQRALHVPQPPVPAGI